MNRMVRRALSLAILISAHSLSIHAQPASKLARSAEGWHARRQHLSASLRPASVAQTYGLETLQRQFWNGLGWSVSSQTNHSYQAGVRRVTTEYDWSGAAFTPTFRSTFGTDGLLAGTDVYNGTVSDFEPQSRYSYEFFYHVLTGDRIVGSVTVQQWNGSAWTNAERDTYTIGNDESGDMIVVGGMTEVWNGSAWVRASDFQLVQTGDDVIQTTRTWWSDTDWQNESLTRFPATTVAALYHRLTELELEFRDMAEFSIGLLALPDMEIAFWDPGQQAWMPDSRRLTELYDLWTGKPSAIAYEVWDGTGWTVEWRQSITYSIDGRPQQSKSLFPSDPGSETGLVETYFYDDRGLLIDVIANMVFGNESMGYSRYLMTWTDLSVDLESSPETPVSHVLHPAYPNPFNPTTAIVFDLASPNSVNIAVHDLLGRRVSTLVDRSLPAGRHEVTFDATGLPTGLYMIRMETPGAVSSRAVTLMK